MVMGENIEKEPPVLLISHRNSNHLLSYKLLENNIRVLNITILRDKIKLGSCYGWLVLANFTTNDCCLWNPKSTEIIELPQLPLAHMYCICVLSKPPTEPDCYILFNSTCCMQQSFCRIGDEEFVTLPYQRDEDGYARRLLAVGSFKGKIYGFTNTGHLFVTIHFVGKTLELRPIMVVDEPWRIPQLSPYFLKWCFINMWLIESPQSSGSELLLVQKLYTYRYFEDGLDFKVFRIDTDQMKCVELDHIGKRAIFVSHHGGALCCSSTEKIKPNSIYYTNHYGRGMYVFDFENRSITPLLPSHVEGPIEQMSRADVDDSLNSWVEHQLIFPLVIH
ncbi:hypothetical protein ABFX02_03G061900 [Erythranthe guttata]